jgi:tRNA A-37 threonylcarbamoyl transferase component Bud32
MINAKREENCVAVTTERKYFKVGNSWVKRSLRPKEWQVDPMSGMWLVPRFGIERIMNEGACMEYIAKNTNIPVPKLYSCFEDDEAAYLVMEFIEGVTMSELHLEERKVVEKELEGHLKTMRGLKSSVWGGPSGIVSKH